MLEFLQNLDHRLFFLINNGWSCRLLDSLFVGLSVMGAWSIGIVAAAILGADGWKWLWRHIAVVLVFVLLATSVNNLLKHSIDRARPLLAFSQELAQGTVHINVLELKGLKNNSFPSGHAMLAFFLMTYVGQCKRGYRPWLLLMAAGIAVSRVYVGSHFPSDCLAGAGLGALWGLLAWWTFEKLRYSVWKTALTTECSADAGRPSGSCSPR